MSIDREKVLVAAQKFVEKKRYPQAVLEYQKIIEQDPNDARTLLKIGDLQLKMEAFPEAIATYERVGRFYAQQGFALKAIAVYKQIREIVGKNVPHLEERYAHIPPKLAELYQGLGLVSDALAALDEVATRLQRQQRDTEAIEVFRKIVGLDPTNPLPHLRLAEALSRTRDADGAVSEFSVAAALLVKLGRRDDALKVLERLLHHRPEPAQARLAAELYIARNTQADAMQALAKLQICFQSNPKDLTTLDLLAKAFVTLGQARKGIEVQKEMARIARDQQRFDVFAELVDKLLAVAPEDEAVQQLAASRAEIEAQSVEQESIPAPEGTEEINDVEILGDDALEEEVASAPDIPQPAMSEADPIPLRASADSSAEAPEVVTGSELEVVEGEPDPRLLQLLEEAQSYRRVRLYARAIKALADALEIDGRSIPVRVELRDVYLESGETADAVTEMIHIASLQLDGLDGDGAAATLQDVLALDPANERAAQMLRELGYAPVEEVAEPQAPYAAPAGRARLDSYDPEAPLPSYDLDEVSTSQAFAESKVAAAGATHAEQQAEEDAPLPSFPLDAPESEAQFELVASRTMEDGPPLSGGEAPTAAFAKPTSEEIEEALEEADFFASRGLFDDARAVLNDALARAPQHRLLLERRSEIDAQATASGGSGTRAKPQSSMPAQAANATDAQPAHGHGGDADEDFDIAASLDALEALDVAPEAANLVNDTGQVDVEEVFAKFKEGVSKTLSVDDGQAHYDLGMAYKEMGLADDAIGEFEIAARDPKLECVARSMVGMIQVERGNLKEGAAAFQKGLAARVRTPEQETVLCFEIGSAYEGLRMTKEAVAFFQRVVRRDPTYRDVQERLRRLTKPEAKPQVQKLAVGADDEFDRAFDELLGSGGKLP